MVNTVTQPIAAPDYPLNSLGWLAAQLSLDLNEAATLTRQVWKSLPLDATAATQIPGDKVGKLLGTKAARDNVLKLNAAPSEPAPPPATDAAPLETENNPDQGEGGKITTERRRLTLDEIKGVANTAGVAQKLVRQLDAACHSREQELHALRGYRREQELIEADATGRLIARLKHSDDLNAELDDLEIELAENTSRASDLSKRVFGVNLQQVIDNQADLEEERFNARESMSANFETYKAQQEAKAEIEALGEEYEVPEGERLGEDQLVDPWQVARLDLSTLGAKRTSRMSRVATSSKQKS